MMPAGKTNVPIRNRGEVIADQDSRGSQGMRDTGRKSFHFRRAMRTSRTVCAPGGSGATASRFRAVQALQSQETLYWRERCRSASALSLYIGHSRIRDCRTQSGCALPVIWNPPLGHAGHTRLTWGSKSRDVRSLTENQTICSLGHVLFRILQSYDWPRFRSGLN